MSAFNNWSPNINSWRTFDALHLRTDSDLDTLKRNVESELRQHEYPAMHEKHALVIKEIERRQKEAAGVLLSQLQQRAVLSLERIAAAVESGNYDRTNIARELSSIGGSLDSSSESNETISRGC